MQEAAQIILRIFQVIGVVVVVLALGFGSGFLIDRLFNRYQNKR